MPTRCGAPRSARPAQQRSRRPASQPGAAPDPRPSTPALPCPATPPTQDADDACKLIQAEGSEALSCPLDLAEGEETCRRLVEQVWGRVRGLGERACAGRSTGCRPLGARPAAVRPSSAARLPPRRHRYRLPPPPQVASKYGKIDVLVLNAAIQVGGCLASRMPVTWVRWRPPAAAAAGWCSTPPSRWVHAGRVGALEGQPLAH